MVAKIHSGAFVGLEPVAIVVEVDIQRGLPRFDIVGLGQGAIKESKNRVMATLKNAGIDLGPKKITVNLVPAHLRKEGSAFDLPIAMAIVQALGLVEGSTLSACMVFGELSLNGDILPIRGAIHMAELTHKNRFSRMMLPKKNAPEAALVPYVEILAPETFNQALMYLKGQASIIFKSDEMPFLAKPVPALDDEGDWSEVLGQQLAKRALEVAACGHHNVLLVGPPGVGKTFMARRFVQLLPDMAPDEILERMKVTSLLSFEGPCHARPFFRTPHHSASLAGMVGGGRPFRPGEFSLAHRGVLFLDEMTEFRRDVLEALRQPLESGYFDLMRSEGAYRLPADFILIGAFNPCPCGACGDPLRRCGCAWSALVKHRAKLSAPIQDRFDLIVELSRPAWEEVWRKKPSSPSGLETRNKVMKVRSLQLERNAPFGIKWNSKLSGFSLKSVVTLTSEQEAFLKKATDQFGLSVRGLNKVLRVARTLADMEESPDIGMEHISEALQYRGSGKTV